MHWISVEDRKNLPEEEVDVLFTDGVEIFKGTRITHFEEEEDYWRSVSDYPIDNVTHWMPLPKLPEK